MNFELCKSFDASAHIDVDAWSDYCQRLEPDPFAPNRHKAITWLEFRRGEFRPAQHYALHQKKQYNSQSGDLARPYPQIESSFLQRRDFAAYLYRMAVLWRLRGPCLILFQLQRVDCVQGKGDPTSGQGRHRDGVEHLTMLALNRRNITGAETRLYLNMQSDTPVYRETLQAGTGLHVKDLEVYHELGAMYPVEKQVPASRSVALFSAPVFHEAFSRNGQPAFPDAVRDIDRRRPPTVA